MTPALPDRIATQFTDSERTLLVELRRSLHRRPELSWKETQTQARLREALMDIGITDIRETAGTGLVAHIPGTQRGGPAVAIRGDIDALPIHEETGLPFASMHAGVMHACGHDMHAAWAVGAGLLLAKQPAVGDVRILLQPAEELGEGAPRVLADGALEGVAAIFGGHVDWRFTVGEVVATPGPLAASTDTFEITFHGKGGHGARPQDTHDPIVGMAAFVSDVQTIVSRRLDPALPGVVTVGMLHAGSAPNVIPEIAKCAGTIRATTPESRALLCTEVERLAHGVAAVHRLTATVQITQGTPPLMNGARAAAWAQDATRQLLGESALRKLPLANMGGEDFAFYTERIEGCFMRIGSWREGRERSGVHTPRFNPDEDALFIAAAVLAESARVASAALHLA
ncbi:MAG: amidohydrolase [Gemmatimonas sp.]|nr:amidohydrolase [Gemmatimonas sp.]